MKVKEFAQVYSGATPSSKHSEYYDGDIVWFTPKDLSDQKTKYVSEGERKITQAGFDSCSTKMIKPYSLLMSSRAPIGLLAINTVECCTNQGFKSIEVDETKCDIDYLYYYFDFHIREIEALGSGTTFKEVSKESIENYDVDLPDLPVQKKLVQVIKYIDRKIALNNSICADLEAMAKQLYDYWFVQFDFPNENGKPYKSSGGKMEWNDELKREIPVRWTDSTITGLGRVIGGATPSTKVSSYYTDKGIAWATPKDLAITRDFFFTHGERDITHEGLDSCSAILMPEGSVLMTSRAPIGYLRIAANEVCTNQGFKSIVPKEEVGTYFTFYTLKHMMPYIKKYGVGSTFAEVSKEDVEKMIIMLPEKGILKRFERTVKHLFEQIKLLEEETRKLSSLRDFLLPMLMNGQVQV